MQCELTTLGGQLKISFEAQTTKDFFEQMAHIQAVTEIEPCSNCKNNDWVYVERKVSTGDKYYEVKCTKCYWVLGFSIPKKGESNMYPRRSNHKTKVPIGPKKDGWHKFDKDTQHDDDDE